MDSCPDYHTAIAACQEELKQFLLEKFPVDYAEIQTNLRTAYGTLAGTEDKEKNYDLAIGAYGEALKVFTADAFPLQYADTQSHIRDVKTGEGVFGLRRAFVLAGTKPLVMSLWNVPDAPTKDLMIEFYERLLNGTPKAEALRQAQLEIRKQHAHPRNWGAFICQGDPGPVSGINYE